MAVVAEVRGGSAFALALDPAIETPDDAQSERILDAALELAGRAGIANLTMDAVAAGARLGRMTVYRRFGSRAELVQALLVREVRGVLAGLAAAINPGLPPAARIADGFVAALRVAKQHPLLARRPPTEILAELNAPGDPTLSLAREFLAAQIQEGVEAGELDVVEVAPVADLLVRIGVSYVLLPGSPVLDDEAEARRIAQTLLAPIAGA